MRTTDKDEQLLNRYEWLLYIHYNTSVNVALWGEPEQARQSKHHLVN